MFSFNLRCSSPLFSCLLIIFTINGLQIINADSFKPIINPNIGVQTTTVRSLTTIASAQSRASLSRQQPLPPPIAQHANSKVIDVPVAEALRREPNSYYSSSRKRQRRPAKPYPNHSYTQSSRARRRPVPKPYYASPNFSFGGSPNTDYKFETDFYEPSSSFLPSKAKKKLPTFDSSKDYGIIDTDIGKFYDSSSASFHVGPLKAYENPSGYFSSVSASGYDGSDFDDLSSYKYSSSSGKDSSSNKYTAPSSSAASEGSTRSKFNSYAPTASEDSEYKFSSGDPGGYGTTAPDADEPTALSPGAFSVAKFNLFSVQPHQTIYQTAPKMTKPKPIKAPATYTPPIKISPSNFGEASIDVITKPLGSATFNLNLSPGTVYSPPSPNYNAPGVDYKQPPVQQQQQQQHQHQQQQQQQPQLQQHQQQPQLQQPQQPQIQQPLPPATSYGVPIAPPLNSYTYNYPNPYQNQANSYSNSANAQSNFVSPSSISITSDAPVNLPNGHFAEPPPLNQQQLSNVDDKQLYENPQTSYDATPIPRRPPKRKAVKVNSKRVSTSPPVTLNSEEELEYDDDAGESYAFFKTMPQPSLPNSYDQEEFHTVIKDKRQFLRPPAKNFDKYEEFSSYFETNDRTRTSKKPKVPNVVTESNFSIPDEDYVDDLVKTLQTTRRSPKQKRPTKSSTAHILDTDDLRDAFETDGFRNYKSRLNKNRNRYTGQQQLIQYDGYDDDNNDDDDDDADDEYESNNDRVSHVTSKEASPKSTNNAKSTLASPTYWDKSSGIYKQYGIRARNDHFQASSRFGFAGYRPSHVEDRSDLFKVNHSHGIGKVLRDIGIVSENTNIGERISSTLRSVTTRRPPSTLYVWDGKTMPKNHKMA